MPFDTTYYIGYYQKAYGKVVIKGGKDTSIKLRTWELPTDIDARFSGADSVVLVAEQALAQKSRADQYYPDEGMIIIFIIVFAVILFQVRRQLRAENKQGKYPFVSIKNRKTISRFSGGYENNLPKNQPKSYLAYDGIALNFSEKEIEKILVKHFPYFVQRSMTEKKRFLLRLNDFLKAKTFKIHDVKGYKEMPVLISAAAIQLTFGLKKYLLPNFEFIHVYPKEFMRVDSGICYLEGNVSGHTINLSWKHFLEGYENKGDGQNVGLHEMAHALYYQTFIVEENVDKNFRELYDGFVADGNKAFNTEKNAGGGLYSEYAVKNFQEFWAESAELFFEKPRELRSTYPNLYETMKLLLNQDPADFVSVFS